MSRYPANIIIKNPATPTGPTATGRAPGIWRMDDVAYWKKQGLWPDPSIVPDQYFPYVSMLLATTSLNGGQNNTFLDSSSNNFTVNRGGNTTQGSFNPYGALWSNYFGGSSSSLRTTALNISSGDFTVEAWVYLNAMPTSDSWPGSYANWMEIVGVGTASVGDGWQFRIGQTVLAFGTNGDTTAVSATHNMVVGQWYHLAVTRSGNVYTLYRNGTSIGSAAYTANSPGTGAFTWIGTETNEGAYLNGYVSNVRVVAGTAVYSGASFTPPTAPLTAISGTSLLTCQGNRFRDASANNFTITRNGDVRVTDFSPFSPGYPGYSPSAGYSSMQFDGAGDWVNMGGQSAFEYGTGAFTIECWFYALGLGQMIIDGRPLSTNGDYVLVSVGGGGTLQYYSAPIGEVLGTTQVQLGAWNHFALTRSGSTTRMFLNGALEASFTDNTFYLAATDRPIIGTNGYRTDISHFNGYMSNFRIVKGTAVYTAAFTPPTAPVTAISGTSLLLNASNFNVYDAATVNDLETVGSAQVSTVQSKFGGSSLYFDGSGDYLNAGTNPAFAFGTGSYTVEAWVYVTGSNTENNLVCNDTTNGFDLYFNYSSNTTRLEYRGGANVIAFNAVPTRNTWVHVALVREGTGANQTKLYFNGVSQGSGTDAVNWTISGPMLVGGIAGAAYYSGYIDDLRITKGVARYTANFTPPTAAFPTY